MPLSGDIALTSANRISSSGMPLNLGIDREQGILRRAILLLDESHPTFNFREPAAAATPGPAPI